MPTARFALAAATGPDGRIYALGGDTNISVPTVVPTVEAYDPETDNWSLWWRRCPRHVGSWLQWRWTARSMRLVVDRLFVTRSNVTIRRRTSGLPSVPCPPLARPWLRRRDNARYQKLISCASTQLVALTAPLLQ